jgi:hypothetical protein
VSQVCKWNWDRKKKEQNQIARRARKEAAMIAAAAMKSVTICKK